MAPGKIDKSQLGIAEPKHLRDKAHLKFVASQACLVCGRQPSDPHHLRFAQPRAIGLKVSDEFTVPLCRGHHRQLHQTGNEVAWWKDLGINSLEIARGLWDENSSRVCRRVFMPQRANQKLISRATRPEMRAAHLRDGLSGAEIDDPDAFYTNRRMRSRARSSKRRLQTGS